MDIEKQMNNYKAMWGMVIFIIATTISGLNYLSTFATKDDLRLSQLATELRMLNIFMIELEYKIASGQTLSPIEKNTYDKFENEIDNIKVEKKDILNE